MATIGGMPVHVSILMLQEKTLKLHRHYAGFRRLLVVVDASESTATGATPQQALLHQLDLLVPELAFDSDGKPSEWRLLVVATNTNESDALQLQNVEALFLTLGARFKEMKCAAIGMQDDVSNLDTAIAWLQRPV
jgi:hypothetical protein